MHLTLKYCIHCTPMNNWCKNWALMNTNLIMYDNAIFLNVKPSLLTTNVKQIVLMLNFDGFLMNIVCNPTNSRD